MAPDGREVMNIRQMETDLDADENAGRRDPTWIKAFLVAMIAAVVSFTRCEDGRKPGQQNEEVNRQVEGTGR